MAPASDPRSEIEPSIRPVVEPPRKIIPTWLVMGGGAIVAMALFLELDARRQARSAPSVRAPAGQMAANSDTPPLHVPPEDMSWRPVIARELPQRLAPLEPRDFPSSPSAPPVMSPGVVPAQPIVTPQPLPPMRQEKPPVSSKVLVFDTTSGIGGSLETTPQMTAAEVGKESSASSSVTASASMVRARPGGILNRSTIVPQGTLIPAVLETAFDSTRAGGTRGLVTRDVMGFDGTRALIPRGSRLYGEYRADLAAGQNRALVIWTRLVRPDGVSVDIDSPAADPLGRNGIRGKVNTHFLERFGSALLQTSLDIGGSVAAREISRGSGTVAVLSFPGATTNVGNGGASLIEGTQYKRTLRVRQGVSVSVFVSRDLDFTAVDSR